MLLGLSIFSVFFTHVIGFAGAGGLCTLVLAFLAALGWKTDKVTMTLIWIKHLDSDLFTEHQFNCLTLGPSRSHGGPVLGCVPAPPVWPDWSRDHHSEPQPQHSG